MCDRPKGLRYRKAGAIVKIISGKPGRPATGEVVQNIHEAAEAKTPRLCAVRRKNGDKVYVPSSMVKVIS